MKITQHTILAFACATLLLTAVLAPAQANARDQESRGTRYAENDGNNDQYNNQQKNQRTPRSSDSQSEAPAVSRSEAAAIAERETGGRVLSVRENGRYWQVQVLVDEKRVRFVNVDMRSGRVR